MTILRIYIQIPMGVLLCNENKLDEMGITILPNGGVEEFDNTQYHSILFGGDQLG